MAIETGQDCWRCNSPKCDQGVTLGSAIVQLCGDCYDLYIDDEMRLQLDLTERAELLDQVAHLESEKSRLEDVGEGIALDNQSLKYEVSELQVEIGQLKQALQQVTNERDNYRQQLGSIVGIDGHKFFAGGQPLKDYMAKRGETHTVNSIPIEYPDIITPDENDPSPVESVPIEVKEASIEDPGWDDDPNWKEYLERRIAKEKKEADDDSEPPDDSGSIN